MFRPWCERGISSSITPILCNKQLNQLFVLQLTLIILLSVRTALESEKSNLKQMGICQLISNPCSKKSSISRDIQLRWCHTYMLSLLRMRIAFITSGWDEGRQTSLGVKSWHSISYFSRVRWGWKELHPLCLTKKGWSPDTSARKLGWLAEVEWNDIRYS